MEINVLCKCVTYVLYSYNNLILIFVRIMATTIGKPCNKTSFKLFCRVCDDIFNAKNEKKVLILEKFIGKCRGSVEKGDNLNIVSQLVLEKNSFFFLYSFM